MNTCVDPPHDGRVVAVRFQPTTGIEHRTPLAVTVGVDGKFKIWTLGEEMVIKGKQNTRIHLIFVKSFLFLRVRPLFCYISQHLMT